MQVKMLPYLSVRSMTNLACRFCRDESAVFVVDPQLDLRYRFEDIDGLTSMLKARKLRTNAEDIAAKYQRWWNIYTTWRDSAVQSPTGVASRDREQRQQMLDESEGLLDALRLPNDLSSRTPVASTGFSTVSIGSGQSDKHMSMLRKAGMIKIEPSTSSAHLVGLLASLLYSLQNLFTEELAENALNVSPPHFVRGAIIDGVNVPKEWFPRVTTDVHSRSMLYLTGHSISSLIALFVKKSFVPKSNRWPVQLLSSGATYNIPSEMPSSKLCLNNTSQHTKALLLSLCRTEDEENAEYDRAIRLLQKVLAEKLSLKIVSSLVYAHELLNYESSATSLATLAGIEVARVCTIGSYISRRLCILLDSESETTDFVRISFVEIDLTRIIAAIVEEHLMGEESVPGTIRQLIVSSRFD